MVCFTGQVSRPLIGNDAFQEVDIVGITRSITKYGVMVKNRDDLGRIIKEAFYIARSGRPGPVVIDLPKAVSYTHLIFVCHWGIKGAAAATVIGQVVSGLMVIYYFSKKRKMDLKQSMFVPKAGYLKMIVSLGMASCINQIAMAIVQITMNNTLRYYGAQSMYGSEIPLACVGVISKVNMVCLLYTSRCV